MKLNLESRHLISLVKWIVSLNFVFLAGSFLFHHYFYGVQNGSWESGSPIKYILVQFYLATENVLATWYSSMLLLSVGIIFFICYLIQRKSLTKRKDRNLAYGYLIFSGIFGLLSLDELASLHERLGNINALNPLGDYAPGWVALLALPIVLVAGFMIWFCLQQIKHAPIASFFAVAGILLFASVPVQEYFEMQAWQTVDYIDTWQRPIAFLLLEEGSELFGATLMMVSGILFAGYKTNPNKTLSLNSNIYLDLKLSKRNSVFQSTAVIIALLAIMIIIVTNNLLILEGDHGIRQNWFPAATAFLSSVLCIYLYFQKKRQYITSRKIFMKIALFSICTSAYFGGNLYSYMYIPGESVFKIVFLIFLWLIVLTLGIKLFIAVKDIYSRTATITWVCLLIPAFGIFSWYAAALAFIGFSSLLISLLNIMTLEVSFAAAQNSPEKKILK